MAARAVRRVVARATNQMTLVDFEEVIRAAVQQPIRRATGLAERLGWQEQPSSGSQRFAPVLEQKASTGC